jgi:hypothetical protein
MPLKRALLLSAVSWCSFYAQPPQSAASQIIGYSCNGSTGPDARLCKPAGSCDPTDFPGYPFKAILTNSGTEVCRRDPPLPIYPPSVSPESQAIQASAPKVVDFSQRENREDGSHVVTFNGPSANPPNRTEVPGTQRMASPSSLVNSIQANLGTNSPNGQSLAQSLTASLDNQLDNGTTSSQWVPPQPNGKSTQAFVNSLIDSVGKGLDPTTQYLSAPKQVSQLVDILADQLDQLSFDPNNPALSQLDIATNPLNLRKGLYEYNRGIIEALTKAVDYFFPPVTQQ